jgi:hypothetical protein
MDRCEVAVLQKVAVQRKVALWGALGTELIGTKSIECLENGGTKSIERLENRGKISSNRWTLLSSGRCSSMKLLFDFSKGPRSQVWHTTEEVSRAAR